MKSFFTKKTEQVLQATEEDIYVARYVWLYQNSPVPYVSINSSGVITQVNLATLRLFHTVAEKLVSKSLLDFLSLENENELSVILGKIQTGVPIDKADVQILLPEGVHKWVLLSVLSYGQTEEYLVSLVDVTKQKQIDIAKSEFVSLASHQLRTPMAAIKWNLELLGADYNGELNSKQKKFFKKIEKNIGRMNTLIDDFLSVSKLETGTFTTSPQDIALPVFFDEIVDEFQATINTKHITIYKKYVADTQMFHTDMRLFHIIVSNLVSNAVKYTPEEGEVTVGYTFDEEKLVIHVYDTGLGIPKDEQENLFSKFFRASNAKLSKSEGTGLGLYIVKQSVEILKGTITVQSTQGEGTHFTVTLPV